MNALRLKMIEDMQLHGFAERTQEVYLLAVRQLAKYYQKSPDQIEEEELRKYFLFLKNERHVSRSTCTLALPSLDVELSLRTPRMPWIAPSIGEVT